MMQVIAPSTMSRVPILEDHAFAERERGVLDVGDEPGSSVVHQPKSRNVSRKFDAKINMIARTTAEVVD